MALHALYRWTWLLPLVISGCSGSSPGGASEATEAGIELPPIAAAVSRALKEPDVQALVELLDFEPTACDANPAPGALICPTNVAAGTLLSAVPVGRCQAGWILEESSKGAASTAIESVLKAGDAPPSAFETYAVAYDGERADSLVWIGAAVDNKKRGLVVLLSSEGVTGISTSCGNDPGTIAGAFETFILPPAQP